MQKLFTLGLCLLLFTASKTFAQGSIWQIEQAANLNGQSYTGTVDFTIMGRAFAANWATTNGNYSGCALMMNQHLFAGWTTEGDCGVVGYRFLPNGNLSGIWTTVSTVGKAATEVIEGEAKTMNGQFNLRGINTDGKPYTGTVRITPTGDTYQFEWQIDQRTYSGIGFKRDGYIFVSWSDNPQFGIIDYLLQDNTAQGIWSVNGATTLGQENLIRQ